MTSLLEYLPRGNMLDEQEWQKRHSFLQWILFVHLPGLFLFGLALHHSLRVSTLTLVPPLVCLLLGRLVPHRRLGSLFITAGLVWCSAALVVLSRGSIEAHFHFFIVIGFIALYQDWLPFLWNIVFTVISHGLGSAVSRDLIFNHQAGQASPWVWSGIHGLAVLAACIGVVVFWRSTEQEQEKSLGLTRKLSDAEIDRRKFASDMLVNLARRNQSLLYRQLEIINQLEDQERDPDALAELFRLDHLATRIRRNAESLLVLSGEGPPRVWSEPVLLLDVVRATIAETEDLDRVAFYLNERLAVAGHTVTDLTHLLAELVENAVRFSPPEASVIIRVRPYPASPGAHVLTVEDCGIGMRPEDLAAANELLANPREIDLSVSRRLGLHVVARLAERHGISVSLLPTPGSGVTAVVVLPSALFAELPPEPAVPTLVSQQKAPRAQTVPRAQAAPRPVVPGASPGSPRVPAATAPRAPVGAAPAGASAADPFDFGLGDEEPWSGWWEPLPDDEDAGMATPATMSDQMPEPASVPLPGGDPSWPADLLLARRVPQSHLAPELREQPRQAPASRPAAPDGARTRAALSRYQASRRAARALVEEDLGDGHHGHPGLDGLDGHARRPDGGGPS